jgi:plastocyanin
VRNGTKLLALLGVLALSLVACGDDETPDAGNGGGGGSEAITITAQDFAFSESEIAVEAGAEIELTLENGDDAPHTFTSDDLGVDVEADGGAEASTTFTAPDEDGSFEFHCEIHPDQMTGTVVVGEGGSSSGGSKDSDVDAEDLDY